MGGFQYIQLIYFTDIGNTYTDMVDMPVDDHRILRATGQLVCRPEIEEVEKAYDVVTDEQLQEMYEDCDVIVYDGGQDVYDYFIALE